MATRHDSLTAAIDERLLSELQEHVATREIERGLDCLRAHQHVLADIDARQAGAARLLVLLAIWSDIGFAASPPVKELLRRFASRSHLSISEYLCLRMTEGMVAMADEAMDLAILHFDFVLGLPEELDNRFLLSIAYYWKGRCLRRRGDYDEALVFTGKGRDIALELRHPRMAAVMQVLEGWILFQQGKWKEAVRVSEVAETALGPTDDYVTLGNIQSFYGRMARREGRFDRAIELFANAIEQYRKRDGQHPNLARSLANMALAKRAIALQLQRRIDVDVQRQRKASSKESAEKSKAGAAAVSTAASGGSVRAKYRARLSQLRREALEHLEAARAIYQQRPNYHGSGTVFLNAAYVHLDNGDFHSAEVESSSAYDLAAQKHDNILMGRARILQCQIENAKVEEEIVGGTDPSAHARRALNFSQEAVELAKHTQHHLLLSNAYLWQGLTQCNSFFDNLDAARESYDLAREAYGGSQADNIWQELQALRARILRKGSVDPVLRAWSQGTVGEKTFRQISDEFAEIVIARVFEREGRKVSRVASRLSISPKKVRRILARVGRRKPRG
ncbi:MAG TPA: tetratricopeptide repeat protein [Terriglobales bacterium]|nr:tetratricopeptide repeat protein [Terriglobales bacterium]